MHTTYLITSALGGVFLAALSAPLVAQSDVTQPTDAVIASSSNSPGSEGVANAIDGKPTKYLNFDAKNNAATAGFVVTPAVGLTRVTGLSMQSANDAPDRDPKVVTLEGSNDDKIASFSSGAWTLITKISDIPPFENRFQTQTFSFKNTNAYKHYRWTVVETAGPSSCCFQIAEVEFLGSTLPSDITQPTDPILASSSNSPGSEGVANAIDGKPTKYLNFDAKNNAATAGFVVSPAVGRTLVTGMKMQAANDAPDRDPKVVTLEGSNDDKIASYNSGSWKQIIKLSDIATFDTRFETKTFLFDNAQPYKHYRWTVVETAGPSSCCFQIAEVELLGGTPQDVTQPTDAVIASSSNSPGSEGVANAIDGKPTKYLNFDAKNNAATAGFVVTPAVGPTSIIGLTMQSANDAPDRDPKLVKVEGSNDDKITSFSSGKWDLIAEIKDIPTFENRFQTQEFYFPPKGSYKHYRWTVVETQGPSSCCFQIAEVELLAVIDSAPPTAKFLTQPVDTPALEGQPATFFVKVDGPWTVQWHRDGQPIAGARGLTYSTPPVNAALEAATFQAEIIGAGKSNPVKAKLFKPSATKSVAVNFRGTGANGAPTDLEPTDIAGVHPQAYWTNAQGNSGEETPSDSDNKGSAVTVAWESTNSWGTGTGIDNGDRKMLNGMLEPRNGGEATITLSKVPAGKHAVIVYTINRPLAFNDGNYSVKGKSASPVIYTRVQNADEYNAAPGYVRGTSTNSAQRTVANYVRFDGVEPTAGGVIEITAASVQEPGEEPPGAAPVNGVQLLINPPEAVPPPQITAQPASQTAVAGKSVSFKVTATGTGTLAYQWKKDGTDIAGATAATYAIGAFAAGDVGNYTVAVSNAGGTAISAAAVLSLYDGKITDRLVAHWKFDETTGTSAANSVAGGQAGSVRGGAKWVAGKAGGALDFNGSSQFVLVPNYTKATTSEAISAWVRATAVGDDSIIMANAGRQTDQNYRLNQFELGLFGSDGDLVGRIVAGPNRYASREGADKPLKLSEWHHVVMTADGYRVTLYRDGAVVGSVDYLGKLTDPTANCLGIGALLNDACDNADGGFWTGQIDDVAVWTRTLGANEVAAIYQAGLAGKDLSTAVPGGSDPGQGQGGARPAAPSVTRNAAGAVVLNWTASGKLQQSTNLQTWTDVAPAPAGNTATITPGADRVKFYRIAQ